ncbi:hypothetical protein AY578_22980 [Streptomyces thermocarboxydus]|uniref:hypothetical protein n=1 Tax=Streptomyces thermocarboxydus TaxID=59299 RepID=UPI0022011619|nr:hypothetical protein AY578_22980 [Streptomyces thermocarboxydus]
MFREGTTRSATWCCGIRRETGRSRRCGAGAGTTGGATVTPTATGVWTYTVEAWATGHHLAAPRADQDPAGIDTEVVLEEGAAARAGGGAGARPDRKVLRAAWRLCVTRSARRAAGWRRR